MPTSFTEQYFPVFLQVLIAMAIAGGMIGASALLGHRVRNRVKDQPYECGIDPRGSARERFSVKFYLVAMIFILFDIETVFLYPWAVVYRESEALRIFRDASLRRADSVGLFLHLEKGRPGWSAEPRSLEEQHG